MRLGDFKPIALLNSSLKIIAKIMANRLAPLMGDLIGDYQTSFIKGRSILDRIMIIKEVIYQCRRRGQDGYLLKLDFRKAYDMVD